MTPQERDLVAALFERLAGLEAQPRDTEAERLITQGLTSAPHAIYPLVQTVLLQEEALKRANARIEELEAKNTAEPQAPAGGFLDNMRGALFGRGPAESGDARGSVPSVRPGGVWNNGQAGAGAAPSPFQPSPGPAMAGPHGVAGRFSAPRPPPPLERSAAASCSTGFAISWGAVTRPRLATTMIRRRRSVPVGIGRGGK